MTLTGIADINGTGNSLNNTLLGNAGNNTLDGGLGADAMTGGAGNDTYIVDDTGDSVTENASEGTDTVQASISYALGTDLENLTLTGSTDIDGTGNAQDNTIAGNSGSNTLDGGLGADTMSGGLGDDTYVVDDAGDLVTESAGEGVDTVLAGLSYNLTNNVENLTLTGATDLNGTGNSLANILTGNSGANILDGEGGADTMSGATGDDTYIVDDAGDVVTENANEGTDSVQASVTHTLSSNVENLTLTGSADIDGFGNDEANAITGNSGSNTLDGGLGNDTLRGGDGSDHYTFTEGDGQDAVLDSNGSLDRIVFDASVAVASVGYSQSGNDLLIAYGASGDTINALDNTILGNSGNNDIDGGLGADYMAGGTGDDTYFVDDAGDIVFEAFGEGDDTVEVGFDYTLDDNVENLVLTGTADLNGTGNDLDNSLIGNSGNNTLDGGLGADVMIGSSGNDTFIVDNLGDSVTGNAGTDLVLSSVDFVLGSGLENLTLTGAADINGTGNGTGNIITGNSGNNILTGGGAVDTIIGGAGNDTLDGSGGNDTMSGGLGDDVFIVSNNGDIVSEQASEGTDTVEASVDYMLTDNVENLTLTGGTNKDGTGNALDNVIIGNTGNNSLSGGDGQDTLWGDLGADTFVFEAVSAFNDIDVIADFNTTQGDVIDLSDVLAGSYNPGTDDILDFVMFEDSGSDTIVSVDLDGTGGASTWQQIATLNNVTGLTDENTLISNGNLTVS